MVLQRDTPLKIWGWAAAGEKVTVSFSNASASAVANDKGEWSVMLPAQQAGGPLDMKISGSNQINIKNILVGDVWLASGQSNMEFPLATQNGFGGVIDQQKEIAAASYPQIRLFTVTRNVALSPVNDVDSTGWFETTPETAAKFSAVGYLFARDLYQRYHIPIGVIHSSWGGTPAEAWTSEAAILKLRDFDSVMKRKAAVTQKEWSAFDDYVAQKNAWHAQHKNEDRGTVDGKPVWASADLNDASWETTTMPKPWPTRILKNFDSTIWYRKHVQLSSEQLKQEVNLHLNKWVVRDTTYVNGHEVGATNGGEFSRDYHVDNAYLHAGDNVITMRVVGHSDSGNGFVGSYADPADLFMSVGNQKIPLAGDWKVQAGPDLSTLPEIPAVAEFRSNFPLTPTLLFNAMIAPLDAFKIKGVIWYQGEANWANPAQYRKLFPAMIKDWRNAWGYEFPFLFVQLAGFGSDQAQPADYAWAELREAQDMTLSLPNTGMATAIDIGDAEDIHPRNKQEVARRLALAARKLVYHDNVQASGPRYKGIKVEGNKIRVQFSETSSGLQVKNGTELRGFAIAGTDGKYAWAKAIIDGNNVIVSNEAIKQPKGVRYDWGNTPQGNLYNKDGLPALPFRSDGPR
jgi:sialate O-acetylesterase